MNHPHIRPAWPSTTATGPFLPPSLLLLAAAHGAPPSGHPTPRCTSLAVVAVVLPLAPPCSLCVYLLEALLQALQLLLLQLGERLALRAGGQAGNVGRRGGGIAQDRDGGEGGSGQDGGLLGLLRLAHDGAGAAARAGGLALRAPTHIGAAADG